VGRGVVAIEQRFRKEKSEGWSALCHGDGGEVIESIVEKSIVGVFDLSFGFWIGKKLGRVEG
jgi:hypothetical protein